MLARALRNPHLWIVTVMIALLGVIHYHEVLFNAGISEQIGSILALGLTRQTFGRILFLIPVAYGTAKLGTGGGISILVLVAAAMLPRVFLISPAPKEAMFETAGIIFTGTLLVALFDTLQKGRRRLSELETTQSMLNLQIKRLGILHAISSILGQSLELNKVLNAAMDRIRQLLEIDVAWLYLWDEESWGRKLKLAASNGLSETVLTEAIKFGEILDSVAQSRQPIVIENVPADPLFSSTLLREEGLQSVLIVPLISQGEVMGTLGVGARLVHHFPSDEVDLLTAIEGQISMVIENARLYEKERLATEALRISEKNYREIFENASDAIWIHDLDGRIIAFNNALERLTGYERDDLIGENVSILLPSHDMSKVDKEAHDRALRGEHPEALEQELVKKDGGRIIIQMGTSLVTKDGNPWAFQHIARDITEGKRIQENLKLYVQRVTQAQEAERKRIARELHDETAQDLVVVARNLDDFALGNSQTSIEDIRAQVRSILQGVRNFSQQLRPSILDDLGLLPAVNWLASDLTKNYNIKTEIEVVGSQRKLPPDAELMLFRITQEALTNVRRHSGANRVNIRVEFFDSATRVTISDNGRGFEIPSRAGDLARIGKLGLAGMQERAQLLGGALSIESKPGKGSAVTIEVPL